MISEIYEFFKGIGNLFVTSNKDNQDMVWYSDYDYYLTQKYQLPSIGQNLLVQLAYDKIIYELLESYHINQPHFSYNLINQVKKDFNRFQIYFNFIRQIEWEQFNQIIEKYHQKSYPKVNNWYFLIMLLVNQAPFYYPYYLLHRTFHSESKDIVPEANDIPYINLIERNTELLFIYHKRFILINIDDNQKEALFTTRMIIKIDYNQSSRLDGNKCYIRFFQN